jgi:hypothetical protein
MPSFVTYVVTHKALDWAIPFPHRLVTVGNYREEGAINSCDIVDAKMNADRTAAFYRCIPAVLRDLKEVPASTGVAIVNHRFFIASNLRRGIFPPVPLDVCRQLITPTDMIARWRQLCLLDLPNDLDIVIANPVNLGAPLLTQYATHHHVDDLLIGFGLAIRMGILKSQLACHVLLKTHAIMAFAARKEIVERVYAPLWEFALEFFDQAYVKREGYQERAVNFVLERLFFALVLQEVSRAGVRVGTTHYYHVDPQMCYVRGQ